MAFRITTQLVTLGVAALVGGVGTAQAAPIIDFNMDTTHLGSTSISYDGAGGPLLGTDIQVDDATGENTPSNNGAILNCIGCTLDFTTGNYTGSTSDSWLFGGGGSITIFGTLDSDGTAGASAGDIGGTSGATLLSGVWDSAKVVQVGTSSFTLEIAVGAFTDTKNDDLENYYGLGPNTPWAGGLNLSFTTQGTPNPANGDAFTSDNVQSGDVVNQVVPVPAAAWLFGSGLLGLATVGRRRRR